MLTNIDINKALDILLNETKVNDKKSIPLLDSLDCYLGETVYSNVNIPPFDRSPLDGYAVRSLDIKDASPSEPVTLKVVDNIPAGYVSDKEVLENQAMRIMTGAKIPDGADVIIKYEDTEFTDKEVKISSPLPKDSNIVKMGEDIKIGDVVLEEGILIGPPEIGILASLGKSTVKVYRKPKIAILSTGDELVDIDDELLPGKIRNSNSYTIAAQVRRLGAEPVILPICDDTMDEIVKSLEPALEWADLIITTGGVSVGDYDVVKDAFQLLGGKLLFWKVKMKPGTPIAVAKMNEMLLIGLSGNPAAAYITFEQFVRPVILKIRGEVNLNLLEVDSILEDDFTKVSGQNRFVRAYTYYKDGKYFTKLPNKHSSGVISSLSGTNSLLFIPSNTGPYKAGQSIKVRLL